MPVIRQGRVWVHVGTAVNPTTPVGIDTTGPRQRYGLDACCIGLKGTGESAAGPHDRQDRIIAGAAAGCYGQIE